MSAEELPVEPIPEQVEVQLEATSSWPGVVRVDASLGDMETLLGKERYQAQLELQRSFGTMGNTRVRMVGGVGTRGAVASS